MGGEGLKVKGDSVVCAVAASLLRSHRSQKRVRVLNGVHQKWLANSRRVEETKAYEISITSSWIFLHRCFGPAFGRGRQFAFGGHDGQSQARSPLQPLLQCRRRKS